MLKTLRAVVRNGTVQLTEQVDLPEGAELLVTVLEDEAEFWGQVNAAAASRIWDNPDDDVYAELLQG